MSALLLARAGANHRFFDPAQLFLAGERGLWIDPSDFSTMWQDAAGTTPVTATGQPVGLIHDKSGNGNHLSQSTSGQRPTLAQDGGGNYYLQFTAANSHVLTAGNGSGLAANTDSILISVGARFDTTSDGTVVARSLQGNADGRYYFARFGVEGGMEISVNSTGGFQNKAAVADTSTAVRVITGTINRNGTGQVSKIDDSSLGSNTGSAGSDPGMTSAYRYLVGGYNNPSDTGEVAFFDGRLYSLVTRFAAIDTGLIARLRTWQGMKCGVTV